MITNFTYLQRYSSFLTITTNSSKGRCIGASIRRIQSECGGPATKQPPVRIEAKDAARYPGDAPASITCVTESKRRRGYKATARLDRGKGRECSPLSPTLIPEDTFRPSASACRGGSTHRAFLLSIIRIARNVNNHLKIKAKILFPNFF